MNLNFVPKEDKSGASEVQIMHDTLIRCIESFRKKKKYLGLLSRKC